MMPSAKPEPSEVRLENRFLHSAEFSARARLDCQQRQFMHCLFPHDPTRSKPLLVHVWLRQLVGRVSRLGGCYADLNQMTIQVTLRRSREQVT